MATVSLAFTTTTPTVFTVTDSSCAALKTAVASINAQYRILACADELLSVGVPVLYTTASLRGVVYQSTVTAMVASPPAVAYNEAQQPVFQSASMTYDAPSTGGTTGTLSVVDTFGTATPEQYQAITVVFGAVITALAVIWGVRRILAVLGSHTEA